MSKKIKIILSVSVFFNLLLVSIVAGHMFNHWSSHPWHEVKRELSPEARNIAGRAFQSTFRDIRPLGNKARKARGDLVKILTARKFDEAAFDKAAARLMGVRDEMKVMKVQAIKEIASQLSVEDRRKMAERMTRMVGGGYERRVKRHRKPKMIKPDHKPQIK